MKSTFIKRADKFEISLPSVAGIENLKSIVRFLEKEYDAKIVKEFDGFWFYIFYLLVAGHPLEVRHHDDLGIDLICADPIPESIKNIVEDLERRLDD